MLFVLLSKRFLHMTVLDGFAFVDIHANLLDCYKCRQIECFQQRHVAGEYAVLTVQPPVR